jgi:hypothetical protein
MKVTGEVKSKDALFLSARIRIASCGKGIRDVEISDRGGLEIKKVTPDYTPYAMVINTGELPRGRFPLFIRIENGEGEAYSKEHTGPIFPAPTEEAYEGGIRLPIGAIDIDNDPAIRKTKGNIEKGLMHASRIRATAVRLDANVRDRAKISLVLGAFGFFYLTICALLERWPWWGIVMASGPMAASLIVAWSAVKTGEDLRRIQEEGKENRSDLDQEMRKLGRWGVYGRIISPTIASEHGGCGCTGQGLGGCGK